MKKILYVVGMLCMLMGCVEHEEIADGRTDRHLPIKISSSYPFMTATRAIIDGGFVAGDRVGVFVVDYKAAEEGEEKTVPGIPAIGNGRGSNVLLTLQEDGRWKSNAPLYWTDMDTPADFYGYYPFDNYMASVTDYPFAVADRQDSEDATTGAEGYAQSDLLRAKTANVWPTTETVNMQYKHIMAGVCIRLEMGAGFTASEWADMEKTVLVKNTVMSGTVNLVTGSTNVDADVPVKSIVPLSYNGNWRALVFPQTVEAGKVLMSVTIDGQNYMLTKQEPMTYYSGKMHQFTITVDRSTATGQFSFTLADEGILPWENDADLHEGLVREYVTIHVEEPGTLEQLMRQKFADLSRVENLKVSGNIKGEDIDFMWQELSRLKNVNLLNALITDNTLNGPWLSYQNPGNLEHIAFPEKGLKKIGGFINCSLKGSLVIPEGVETIVWQAFSGNPLSGTVSLPSTLKYTDDEICQYNYELHGDLILPEGLVTWCGIGGKYTGRMHIPSSLKQLNAPLPPAWTGTIVVPSTLEVICVGAFANSQCTAISLPEGMKEIPVGLCRDAAIAGELVIPSTVEHIGGIAFNSTKINKVILPKNLRTIGSGAFGGCNRLMGTIEIPKHVAIVDGFDQCSALSGVVIPKDAVMIATSAFEGCTGLRSIVCEAEEPPVVADRAFYGVPKDNFTLEVPKGCVQAYRDAPGWSDFKRIAEYSGFVCRPQAVCALNNEHTETLVLNAEGDWRVARKPDWCWLSQTTGTGKTQLSMNILQMPHDAGNRQDSIIFQMTTPDGREVSTFCVLSQYDYEHEEDSYLTLQTHTKGNGIDIVFMGEGYDGQTIADGSYLDLVQYQMECFFAVEPYRSMRDYFNVYVTFPLSQEAGVNTMYTYVNNHFGTLSHSAGSKLVAEYDDIYRYAIDHSPITDDNASRATLVVTLNSTAYTGQTVFDHAGNTGIAICPPQETPYPCDTRGTVQHEVGGHAFGKLGDEHIAANAFAGNTLKSEVLKMHNRGWYANLATTGKLHDVPWSEFIFDPDYSDHVDVYEGGMGVTRGIYRPEANSCMNYGIPYYNTPSRLAIWKRIKEYAGESWTMEDFRTQDTFEWGPTTVTRAVESDIESLTPITDGNHQMPSLVRFREVGDKVRSIRKELRKKALGL